LRLTGTVSLYEIANLLLFSLNLGVLYYTLRALLKYTRETKRLADAAVEQMPRPYLTIVQVADPSDRALIEGAAVSVLGVPTVQFRNAGTAHAVNIRYRIGAARAGPVDLREAPTGPPLAPGEAFDSGYGRNALSDPALVVAEYESLGGARYRTRLVVEERHWVKNVHFQRLAT